MSGNGPFRGRLQSSAARVVMPLIALVVLARFSRSEEMAVDRARLEHRKESVRNAWRVIESASGHAQIEGRYVMKACVRLLLFWACKDDVGMGYIRLGHDAADPDLQSVQLLMGSDRAKAPLHVNRWGAATEVYRKSDTTSAFFGFMKSSKGTGLSGMRTEVENEAASARFRFEGIVSWSGMSGGVSSTVPVVSPADFDLHQLPEVTRMMRAAFSESGIRVRELNPSVAADCGGGPGLLGTTRAMLEGAFRGKAAPATSCYIYNAQPYRLTLRGWHPAGKARISFTLHGAPKPEVYTYPAVNKAEFRVTDMRTGEQTDFELLCRASGQDRIIPVQIRYQPNWWFRVVLNLNHKAKP